MDFPHKCPVTWTIDVYLDLDKLLDKQSKADDLRRHNMHVTSL